MEKWQFNTLFIVAILGTIFLAVAPAIPALHDVPNNPGAITGIGTILIYVLNQKKTIIKKNGDEKPKDEEE